jgi:hypothetical protein
VADLPPPMRAICRYSCGRSAEDYLGTLPPSGCIRRDRRLAVGRHGVLRYDLGSRAAPTGVKSSDPAQHGDHLAEDPGLVPQDRHVGGVVRNQPDVSGTPRTTWIRSAEVMRQRTSSPPLTCGYSATRVSADVVSVATLPRTSCSRWWSRTPRTRSSCRPAASWSRRSGTAAHRQSGPAATRSAPWSCAAWAADPRNGPRPPPAP